MQETALGKPEVVGLRVLGFRHQDFGFISGAKLIMNFNYVHSNLLTDNFYSESVEVLLDPVLAFSCRRDQNICDLGRVHARETMSERFSKQANAFTSIDTLWMN